MLNRLHRSHLIRTTLPGVTYASQSIRLQGEPSSFRPLQRTIANRGSAVELVTSRADT